MTLIDHEVRRLVAPVCERQKASYAMRCAICVRTLSEKLYLCEVRGQGGERWADAECPVRSCGVSLVASESPRRENRDEGGVWR
jgi:hypothetical protein